MVAKFLKLIFIIVFCALFFFKGITPVACETGVMTQGTQEDITTIKDILYPYLYDLVRTNDFKLLYQNTWVYRDIFLSENFIKTFLNNVDWSKFVEDNKNLTLDNKLNEILKMFLSYADDYYHHLLCNSYKINARACENTINFMNTQLKQAAVFIDHNKQNIVWLIPLGLCYKHWIFVNTQDHTVFYNIHGLLTPTELINQRFPHLFLPENTDILMTLIQHYDSYIITEGTWQLFFLSEEWTQTVSSKNYTIFMLVIVILLIISKSGNSF